MVALAIVSVFGLIVAPIRLAGRGRRIRAAAWVAFFYPMFLLGSLYATWFIMPPPGLYRLRLVG